MKKRIAAAIAAAVILAAMLLMQGCDTMSSSYESDTFEITMMTGTM